MTEDLYVDDESRTLLEAPRRLDQAEHGLSRWVDAFLDRALLGPCWYTAVDTGTYRPGATREQRMAIERNRRAMGIKPSHLDWYVYQRPLFTQFELKVDRRRHGRIGQDQTMAALRRNNIPTAVCETVPQVWKFLTDAGFELHGNAANIAIELHERYLANRREAAVARPKSKSSRKPAARSTFSVKQGHRAGAWK